jgi:hypothetical protein
MGLKDYSFIDPKTPKEIEYSIKIAIKALQKNYPYCIIAESDKIKAAEKRAKGKIQ